MSIYADRILLVYCCAVAGILGAVMGSFLNCAAWRIAHGESFLKGRSHCTACGHVLGPLDLVPVFSWLFLGGKCRYCGNKVSVRYPLTELLFAVLSVLCLLRFDLTALCLRNWIFLCCLFCLSLVDLESYIIPDGCLLISAAAWAAALPFLWTGWGAVGKSLLSAFVFGGGVLLISLLLDKLLKKESLGGGDVKLFAVVGLYLGLTATLFTMILACILGLLVVIIRRGGEQGRIPFGPSIAAAALFMLLYGEGLVAWYLGLLGLG